MDQFLAVLSAILQGGLNYNEQSQKKTDAERAATLQALNLGQLQGTVADLLSPQLQNSLGYQYLRDALLNPALVASPGYFNNQITSLNDIGLGDAAQQLKPKVYNRLKNKYKNLTPADQNWLVKEHGVNDLNSYINWVTGAMPGFQDIDSSKYIDPQDLAELQSIYDPYGLQGMSQEEISQWAQDQIQQNPGLKFNIKEGINDIENYSAAAGDLLSGRNLKAVNDYATKANMYDYFNWFFPNVNNLAGAASSIPLAYADFLGGNVNALNNAIGAANYGGGYNPGATAATAIGDIFGAIGQERGINKGQGAGTDIQKLLGDLGVVPINPYGYGSSMPASAMAEAFSPGINDAVMKMIGDNKDLF